MIGTVNKMNQTTVAPGGGDGRGTTSLTLEAARVISIKILLVISILFRTDSDW